MNIPVVGIDSYISVGHSQVQDRLPDGISAGRVLPFVEVWISVEGHDTGERLHHRIRRLDIGYIFFPGHLVGRAMSMRVIGESMAGFYVIIQSGSAFLIDVIGNDEKHGLFYTSLSETLYQHLAPALAGEIGTLTHRRIIDGDGDLSGLCLGKEEKGKDDTTKTEEIFHLD